MLPGVYETLRRIAAHYMRRERSRTLRPTDLVHEAWLKLASGREREYADRVHFTALAARAMRQVLVDRARARASAKRGGGAIRVTLGDEHAGVTPGEDVLALHAALQALAADVVERADVRMRELRDRACLALEPRTRVGRQQRARGQHLDRHVTPQARVVGAIHLAHPAGAERGDNVVRPEHHACGQHGGTPGGPTRGERGRAPDEAQPTSAPRGSQPERALPRGRYAALSPSRTSGA